ncbi:uncharacterized protein LOC117116574 [Anneissia japonica]|uniref:uncharacterized protein LOC117116574 n=1 Tax=Anneissia japonica TaxID=1529436 RepID=UPI001425573C|nr:uncharacterized protein LOC117116574 [Anneissia japonica]
MAGLLQDGWSSGDSENGDMEEQADDEKNDDVEEPMDKFFRDILNNDITKIREKMNDHGYNALTIGSYWDMALHFAVLNSKIDVIRLFENQIRGREEINTVHIKDVDQCGTALHIAMDGQVSLETVELLLQWGADVNARDIRGGSVLHELIDMSWDDFENDFNLEMAISSNGEKGHSYLSKLDLLHEYKANMNIIHSSTSLTPLHKWCQQFVFCTKHCRAVNEIPRYCTLFLERLLQYECNPTSVDERGESPLFYFSQRHYTEKDIGYINDYSRLCKILIQRTHLKQRNNNDHTILHAAAEFSNVAMVKELLTHTVDVNAKDKFGLTAAHLITHNITADEKSFVTAILKMLTENGADLNIKDNHGSTPLHHAVHMKNITAIKFLMNNGADISVKDKNGMDAQALATVDGSDEVQTRLGVIYKRSALPIIPGTTDVRFGWFYPLCCHITYSGESNGIENPNVVKESEIERFLVKYPPCYHNRRFIIQNSITCFEENEKQCELSEKDFVIIKAEIRLAMDRIVKLMADQSEVLQCDVVMGGSNAEGTKVGDPDEFDFVFILKYISLHVIPIEEDDFKGFVKIKAKEPVAFSSLSEIIFDSDGFIKRSVISNEFHKLFEKCLRSRCVWESTGFCSYAGTTNSEGECWDIGQLDLIWYGAFRKRQKISIDIVPVIKIPGWQTNHLRSTANILQSETLHSIGCYLVMKDSREAIAAIDPSIGETEFVKTEDILYRISFSQIEHAVIFNLPEEIKNGVKLENNMRTGPRNSL